MSSSRLNDFQEKGSGPFSAPDTSREDTPRRRSSEYGLNVQTHRSAVDIPGATSSPSFAFDGGSSLDRDGGLFSQSYGTSPGGHGLGYLMHSRTKQKLSRQESKDMFLTHLHSHDELGELAYDVESHLMEHGGASFSDIGSPEADSKSFAFTQEDLTAPLLPRQRALVREGSSGAIPAAANANATTPTSAANSSQDTIRAIVFGLINATAGIPALVAYAAIVFRDPIYAPQVDLLCKFFFISSALHQTVFCLFSTLPFAMGQVQDVGIIFLSAMGTSIAALSLEAGRDAASALGTSLLTMTLSTFFVGLGTLFVARKSLAQFVQYIPLPVMGGYLAFVGYFCIASGIGLGVSVEIGSLSSWSGLFDRLPLIKLIPTLASCVAMVFTLEKTNHPLALPLVLISLVAVFHIVLAVTGITLVDAQASGWVMPPAEKAVEFWKLWDLYNLQDWKLSGIYFPAMFRQLGKAAGLLLVVVFGSCMDIAAIQQDVPYKIDFNKELTTVAISNIATGVTGIGYTGSYIFSQTVFTMRAGVNSRINGWVIAGAEFLVFALPFSIVQYLPNYFLGALLLWFGVEISRDWLILSYFKLTLVEYGLLWVTFACIMALGLEGGIAAGIIFATLYFAYAYASSQVENFKAGRARSSVVRTVEHNAALDLLWDSHAATAQLQGFVFFGSAQSMGTKLTDAATRLAGPADTAREERHRLEEAIQQSMRSTGEDYAGAKHEQALAALSVAPKFLVIDLSKVTGMDSSGARTVADTIRSLAALGVTPILTGAGHHGILSLLRVHDVRFRTMRWPPELQPPPPGASPLEVAARETNWAGESATMMDLGGEGGNNGQGISDGITHSTNGNDVSDVSPELSFGGAVQQPPPQQQQQEEEEPEAFCFPLLEEGLRFCEDALLEVAVQFGLCTPPGAGTTLKDCLISHLEKLPLTSPKNAEAMAATLRRYMTVRTVRRGEVLWQPDDPAEELYLVERGVIRVDQFRRRGEGEEQEREREESNNANSIYHSSVNVPVRSFELGPGCVIGSTDFYLARPHGTRAVCASVACRVLRLSRSAMSRMAHEAPAALNVLQLAIMRANSSDLSTAADAAAKVQ
jgi:MFS superfamily sulfate permease-like transporter/CRP-like cAMP-binding protein